MPGAQYQLETLTVQTAKAPAGVVALIKAVPGR